MNCPSCNESNREGARFCGACGTSLAGPIRCPRCATENVAGQRFCDACGHELAAPPTSPSVPARAPGRPGSFGNGRYQVQRFIGEGGKKRVYLAVDTRLNREVAIAVIKTEGLDEAGLLRVRREAEAMGRLGDHPNVVTIYDVAQEGDQVYLVTQFMGGGDVEARLQQAPGRRLPLADALRIAGEVASALEHSHARDIVHRDIKPGNVWLSENGSAKLGDFGLATLLDRSRITQQGMLVGTAAYLAPEQALSGEVTTRSDLYALGGMLYEMLTGRPPFIGDDAVSVISQHVNTPPVAPSWHNAEVSKPLENLVLQLLAKDPEERPESAARVLEALAAIEVAPLPQPAAPEAAPPNVIDRLDGGVFVGREPEMERARNTLDEALSGKGRILLIVGEPGIGKTRMAEELTTYARLRGARVLWGRCHQAEGAPPYWPWLQIIRSYVAERDPVELRSELGPGGADIAELASELRERLPDLPRPIKLEGEQAQFRLFDSISSFLRNASRSQPLVLVLGDLHWSDRSSLLLTQFIAHELRDSRILLAGTYRDAELGRHHPLEQTLAELTRTERAERITLRGLSEAHVGRFIELSTGRTPDESLTRTIQRETEGNPFFVSEIVRLLEAEGKLERGPDSGSWSLRIPQGVRQVIGRRLSALSEPCNRALATAAVIGREFNLEVLQSTSGIDENALLDALDEAVAARVIAEVPGTVGRYRFAHAPVRETLRDELSTARRVRLHRRIGEAIESLVGADPDPHLPDLAYHFFEAAQSGDADKALRYARLAAERASRQLAYAEAAAHYERALQALDLRRSGSEQERCDCLLSLAGAQKSAGDAPLSRATFQTAADLARKLGASDALAEAALGLSPASFSLEVGVFDELHVALLEEALAARPEEDSVLRARLLSALAIALYWSPEGERCARVAEEAVRVARQLGDRALLAHALQARYFSLLRPDTLEERLPAAEEMVRVADEAGAAELALICRFLRLGELLERQDSRRTRLELEDIQLRSRELRQPQMLWYAPILEAMRVLLESRLDEAEARIHEALSFGARFEDANVLQTFGVQLALLRFMQGRLTEMEGPIRSFVEQYPRLGSWQAVLAWLHSWIGPEAEARERLEQIGAQGFTDLAPDALWPVSVLFLGEASARLGDRARTAQLYDLLLPHAGRGLVTGWAIVFLGPISMFLGLMATLLERFDEAAGHFEEALASMERMGAPYWVARVKQEYAAMLLARRGAGDRKRALDLLNQALGKAHELGLKSILDTSLTLKLDAQGLGGEDVKTSMLTVASAVQGTDCDLSAHAAPDGTVTLMFSDVEGFTPMTERLGDVEARRVVREHNRIVREQLAIHGGYEVELQGDGFLLAFGSARAALACATAIQRCFRERNLDADEPIRVRMGLHTGEVLKDEDDFFGKTVIQAYRIADRAQGEEILVSSITKALVESVSGPCFDAGREVELKGLKGRHRIFALDWA